MASQLAVAFAVLNAWLVRARQPTPWRGGNARSMREEFGVYGLPEWFMKITGFLKIGLAVALLAGLWEPAVARPAALALGLLMIGAVAMHLKVADPWRKSAPALALALLATVIALA